MCNGTWIHRERDKKNILTDTDLRAGIGYFRNFLKLSINVIGQMS